ncbi:hypothetical protein BH11PSE10_BH11PSE10_19550 [soil metagenome]
MKTPTHLAGLAILALCAGTHVQASVMAFDTSDSFGAAASGTTTYGFDGISVAGPGCSGCAYGPQTVGGVTFDSNVNPLVVAGEPARYGGVQFFSGQSSDLRPSDVIVTLAGTYAIGFTYGAYVTDPGSPVTITLNTGDVFTRFLPPSAGVDTNFLGFVSTTPITSITFKTIDNVSTPPPYAYSMDIVSFRTAAPVPEPAGWALMACGLAAVASATRRRKRSDAA